jgi:hypothetical protein
MCMEPDYISVMLSKPDGNKRNAKKKAPHKGAPNYLKHNHCEK